MSSRPVFVICPGCWHVPAHFDYVTKVLEEAGYKSVPVSLPGNTMSPRKEDGKLVGIQDDVDEVRRVVLEQLDNGENVVVVTHSYGTVPGTAALHGLNTAARKAEGQNTSVVAVAIIAGLLLPPGQTMWDVMGQQLPPQYLRQGDITLPFGKTLTAVDVLYQDLSKDEQQMAVDKLVGQSFACNSSIIPDQCAAIQGIPVYYLACTDDKALLFDTQLAFIEGFRAASIDVQVQIAPTGHSPFLKLPKETASFLRKAAGEEIQTGFEQ